MCEILNCYRTGAQLVAVCGHPAGHYCNKHAKEWQAMFERKGCAEKD